MRRIVIVAFLAACTITHLPTANTREEVVEYVNAAAGVVRSRGAAACAELSGPRWKNDEWYIFLLEANGRTVCHPARPAQFGVMAQDLVDVSGFRFGDAFLRAGEEGGWVEYAWPRPGEAVASPKRSFVRRVTTRSGEVFLIGSGGHDLP